MKSIPVARGLLAAAPRPPPGQESIPVARGLLLCDAVQLNAQTGNVTLVNCFNQLTAASFPCSGRAFCLVAFLSDGYGDLQVRVEVQHLESGRLIYIRKHELNIPDRLHEVRYRFLVTGCVFPDPGAYEARLFIEQELVADTRFLVRLKGADHG